MSKALGCWSLLSLALLYPLSGSASPDAFSKAFNHGAALSFPALDLEALSKQDEITDKIAGLPSRFAVARSVQGDTESLGQWQLLDDGRWQWRLTVKAEAAVHLNFGFDRFNLPDGAELRIVGNEGKDVLGPYTAADRLAHGQLWTPVLAGERALIELSLPAKAEPHHVDLHLQQVNQGYRGFGEVAKECKSGSCNTDVACLASTDPWNQPRRAVGAITVNGTDTCTGSLLNNTRNDGRMLFATATHCQISNNSAAAATRVYWRYESPTCRTPGSGASGTALPKPSDRTTQGLSFLAATNNPFAAAGVAGSKSDWTLLELATPPDGNDFQLYWAGWDRSPPPTTCSVPSTPESTVGLCASIHHPNVDEKRITFVQSPMTLSAIAGASGVHWRADWDQTPPILPNIQPTPSSLPPSVTEPGSSGSPLFNAQRRMIGVLSGGASFCGAGPADLNDDYGGLFHAWDGLGSANTRMRDYLDPLGGNPMTIDGLDSAAQLNVTLSSPAITTPPASGELFTLNASASGGRAPYTYRFDTDSDGLFDRVNSSGSLSLSFPAGGARFITVSVLDADQLLGGASATINVRGASISASQNGALSQVCGNNDSIIDPGEHWQVPVRVSNSGQGGFSSGHALFAKGGGSANLEGVSNSFGHRVQSEGCSYSFIDIASGANAVAALGLSDSDDGRVNNAIALGGSGITLYGQRYTQAVMSTNGYISFAASESGGDFSNSCDGAFGNGSVGPQIRPLHDDLVVRAGGGLRYRYFATCPRGAESANAGGCHVFQWTGVGQFSTGGTVGNAEFQAVVYETSGQITYQYRTTLNDGGASATIGLNDADGNDPLIARCNQAAANASSALCLYTPEALPAGSPIQVTQAVQPLGNLAAGANTTVNVPFYIAPTAGCGAAIELQHIASVDATSASANRSTVLQTSTGASCNAVTLCEPLTTGTPPPPPRRGLYFNALRPGNGVNGYFYPEFGDGSNRQLFGGLWYTANPDRSSIWYQLQGQVDFFGGQLPIVQYRNTAAPNGFATSTTEVGQAWVGVIDPDSLILAWAFNDGRVGAERIDSIGLSFAPSSNNHTQAWFNLGEPGWGNAIEGLDGTGNPAGFEFFATYIYDSSGNPRWLSGDKSTWGNGTINLLDYAMHCPGCAFIDGAFGLGKAAGNMSINYDARNSATLSTSIQLPSPLSGSWNRNQINIIPIVDPVP
ncbi:hypothetical protein [Pseudomarimonas arenosa]|uniref:Lysyl endopeptidase n=1 Tax=Pseudomarimonas arenosa TaxID=2774145 RepID=A0AAW3ZT15_9GAMM|nr:hypothetical protein [Pseudomarimonas arenosa]MBD8528192.1 hypothetical protein [Pseudomarimonas arenosa]